MAVCAARIDDVIHDRGGRLLIVVGVGRSQGRIDTFDGTTAQVESPSLVTILTIHRIEKSIVTREHHHVVIDGDGGPDTTSCLKYPVCSLRRHIESRHGPIVTTEVEYPSCI